MLNQTERKFPLVIANSNLDNVNAVIFCRAWYQFIDGVFNLSASLKKLATQLNELEIPITAQQLDTIFKKSITAEILTKIIYHQQEQTVIEIILQLCNNQHQLFIWTEGDAALQLFKIEHSGLLTDYPIDKNQCLISASDKSQQAIDQIMTMLAFKECQTNTKLCLHFIDDKKEQLATVVRLADAHNLQPRCKIKTYLFTPASGEKIFDKLKTNIDNHPDQSHVLFVDLDRVILEVEQQFAKIIIPAILARIYK